MDADERRWGKDGKDLKEDFRKLFRSAILVFIWSGFSTGGGCGKTYGNVFDGSGWEAGQYNLDFRKKGAKMGVL